MRLRFIATLASRSTSTIRILVAAFKFSENFRRPMLSAYAYLGPDASDAEGVVECKIPSQRYHCGSSQCLMVLKLMDNVAPFTEVLHRTTHTQHLVDC